MWPDCIFGDNAPRLNDASGLPEGAEPVLIQAFIPDPAIKDFNEPILTWFARSEALHECASAPRPVKHGDGCELCAIIADNELRLSV